jgi:hypothetical protein
MTSIQRVVSTVADLLTATRDPDAGLIVVRGPLASVPSIRLAPGQVLQGERACRAFVRTRH